MRLQSVFPLIGLSPNDPASYHASSILPDALGIQHILSSLAASHSYATPVVPAGDPAGRPNLATRLEITSPKNSTLFCATEGDKHQSGWAHFTNALGKEDKHMFWTCVLMPNSNTCLLTISKQIVRGAERFGKCTNHSLLWWWSWDVRFSSALQWPGVRIHAQRPLPC
jgi:hypothetical protein